MTSVRRRADTDPNGNSRVAASIGVRRPRKEGASGGGSGLLKLGWPFIQPPVWRFSQGAGLWTLFREVGVHLVLLLLGARESSLLSSIKCGVHLADRAWDE